MLRVWCITRVFYAQKRHNLIQRQFEHTANTLFYCK